MCLNTSSRGELSGQKQLLTTQTIRVRRVQGPCGFRVAVC